jgi:hypothetical protein
VYEKVKISYQYEEPQTEEKDGFVIVNDTPATHIHFTNEILQDILQKVEKVSDYVIN